MGTKNISSATQQYDQHPFQLSVDQILSKLHGTSSLVSALHKSMSFKGSMEKTHLPVREACAGMPFFSRNTRYGALILRLRLHRGSVMTAVIVLNVLIGFYQELEAEKKMDSLRALSSPTATVL